MIVVQEDFGPLDVDAIEIYVRLTSSKPQTHPKEKVKITSILPPDD